ncbi:MAG: transporter substrate-binding protein [Solirubrobacterales bacterium]|jgi:NitT/TauT family transport system substrate-binding protein/putative hydroxymethylpyrimidine transport system substrate-binding protein|nr:transporter substrate-binding protein [Solirubrobacterales bacterium]
MSRAAASLAAVVAALAPVACGDGGADPGASDEATLILDFTPNAVHAGLYAAAAAGEFEREGIELEIREPSASTDGPQLLEAGRAEFAVLDIHDLAIARERGLDLVGVGAIVQRPLAAVIAGDRDSVRTPGDLEGGVVGVTGLPSDDAVLDSVLDAGGADAAAVERVTIGFDSIAALSAGRVDAATAFWNAEGVALRRLGVPTREFRVDDFGAPPYPELVLATTAETVTGRPELVEGLLAAVGSGQEQLTKAPEAALADLLEAAPELTEGEQRAQLEALLEADAIGSGVLPDESVLRQWAAWDVERDIVARPPRIERAFALELGSD